jgi:hypothetical protein
MKRLIVSFLCLAAGLGGLPGVSANDGEGLSLHSGGLLFGDFYYVPSHHSDAGDGAVGLVLRRGYLTFDAELGEKTFGRLRFELNQSGEFETYTFEADFKDLYVGWNLGRHRLIAGLTSTPTFDLIESVWDLRYLARTPMDLQGVPSRDTGVSVSGPLNTAGTFRYRAMLGSGIEFGSDSSDSSKWMAALTWKPAARWTFDLYADFEELPGSDERTTLQGFIAYQTESLRWGLQYSNQDRQENPPIELASAFLIKKLGQGASLIGRVDRLLEPSPRGDDIAYLPIDPSAKATMFFGGVEFHLRPHWSLIPNTVVTIYDRDDQGVRPRTDVYLRLTLYVNFE